MSWSFHIFMWSIHLRLQLRLNTTEFCENFNLDFIGLFTGEELLKIIALKDKRKWKCRCFPVKFETFKICIYGVIHMLLLLCNKKCLNWEPEKIPTWTPFAQLIGRDCSFSKTLFLLCVRSAKLVSYLLFSIKKYIQKVQLIVIQTQGSGRKSRHQVSWQLKDCTFSNI